MPESPKWNDTLGNRRVRSRYRPLRVHIKNLRKDFITTAYWISRFLRHIVWALARLSLPIKFAIGLLILIEFIVITRWENLISALAPASTFKATLQAQAPGQHSSNFPETPPVDKSQAAAIEAALAKRMTRVVIDDPTLQSNGSIIAGGETLFLYGIQPFNQKQICKRASGEPWACGLHAYATLRNSIAKKTIVCDPKILLPNGVSAICRLGPTDIALALVRDGLVEIDDKVDDAEMVKAQAFAKSRKLGIWDR